MKNVNTAIAKMIADAAGCGWPPVSCQGKPCKSDIMAEAEQFREKLASHGYMIVPVEAESVIIRIIAALPDKSKRQVIGKSISQLVEAYRKGGLFPNGW